MNTALFNTAEAPLGIGRLVTCSVDLLRPHPSMVRLQIVPSASDLSAGMEQRNRARKELLTITQDCYILAGHAEWITARKQERKTLPCHQFEMTEEEALLWLIQKHQRSSGLSDFCRILLALELEPCFRMRARSNQQVGGQTKGSSKLTRADKLDVRSEIAAAAGVSTGNVSKVKQLAMHAHPALLQALREGEVSIHRASLWLQNMEKQLDQLSQYRVQRGITRKVDLLLHAHCLSDPVRDRQLDIRRIGSALAAMGPRQKSSVFISEVKAPGEILLLSTGLLQALECQGELQL